MLGLSTRKVGKALLALFSRLVSASTVSQVAKTLDAAVAAFHRRPLQNRYQALMLDGVVLSRKTGAGALRRPVLVALGLRHDGKKEIIDFRLAASESAAESEVRSRCSVSIGSNQSSKSCGVVSISDCGRQGVVHGLSWRDLRRRSNAGFACCIKLEITPPSFFQPLLLRDPLPGRSDTDLLSPIRVD